MEDLPLFVADTQSNHGPNSDVYPSVDSPKDRADGRFASDAEGWGFPPIAEKSPEA